jgi:hypothetical protein
MPEKVSFGSPRLFGDPAVAEGEVSLRMVRRVGDQHQMRQQTSPGHGVRQRRQPRVVEVAGNVAVDHANGASPSSGRAFAMPPAVSSASVFGE